MPEPLRLSWRACSLGAVLWLGSPAMARASSAMGAVGLADLWLAQVAFGGLGLALLLFGVWGAFRAWKGETSWGLRLATYASWGLLYAGLSFLPFTHSRRFSTIVLAATTWACWRACQTPATARHRETAFAFLAIFSLGQLCSLVPLAIRALADWEGYAADLTPGALFTPLGFLAIAGVAAWYLRTHTAADNSGSTSSTDQGR